MTVPPPLASLDDSAHGRGAPGVLCSAVLEKVGARHAFTTRVGGVSRGIFASLNFGNPSELRGEERDPSANIGRNIEQVQVAIAMRERRLVQVYQVHGGAVHVVSRASGIANRAAPANDPKADAMVSDDPRVVLGVRTADCAPVLLASGDGRVVGAVHAGWRGVVADVLPHAVEAMRGLGAQEIVAAVGPCIGPEAMEVGPEVVAAFRARFGDDAAIVRRHPDPSSHGAGKAMLGLAAALARQCVEAGVRSCDTSTALCSVRSVLPDGASMFFSHRRDAGKTGRMIAMIGTST